MFGMFESFNRASKWIRVREDKVKEMLRQDFVSPVSYFKGLNCILSELGYFRAATVTA